MLSNIEIYAHKTPEKIALATESSELSYLHLFLSANALSSFFCELGLQRERVAVHLPNSVELAIVYLASLMAGVVIVPLSVGLKPYEVQTVISETTCKAFIGNSSSYPYFTDFSIENTTLKYLFTLDEKPPQPFKILNIKTGTFQEKLSLPFRDEPAAIFYTSGSSNKPKGVVHSERSLTAMMDSMVDSLDLTSDGCFLMSEPMSNCSGYTQSLLPLLIGATTVIMAEFSIAGMIDAMRYQPTRMSLMGEGNYEIVKSTHLTQKHFTSLTLNLTGGDRIPKELMGAFKEKTGIPMRLGYGMSECLLLTVNKSEESEKTGSIGQVAKNTTIRLLDQNQNPVPLGEAGEIWVKGPNCMLGYWKSPQLTNQTIVDGWLRTGDLARCDAEGFYWFVGRLKSLIIRSGDNISPFEIEEILTQHPAVLAAGVIGIPHSTEGEVPNAFVELKGGESITEEELITFAEGFLEEYKVPTAIFILEKLPRTSNGKIDRKKLKPKR